VSTSTDGLTFTTETKLSALPGFADPEVVHVGTGLRLYSNAGNDTTGNIYSAISASGGVTAIR